MRVLLDNWNPLEDAVAIRLDICFAVHQIRSGCIQTFVSHVAALTLWESHLGRLQDSVEVAIVGEVHGSEAKVASALPAAPSTCKNHIATSIATPPAHLIVRMAER